MNVSKDSYTVTPMTREQAEACCGWMYAPPYDRIYGWLPWEQMEALGIELGDPDLRRQQYVSVLDGDGQLCGFAQLFPMVNAVRLGLGMRPDLCGQGRGPGFIQAIVETAKTRFPGQEIDLEVQDWNLRAIRAYVKAGFEITDTYEKQTPEGVERFYCMVYQGL